MLNELQTVEAIHASFEVDLREMLREINQEGYVMQYRPEILPAKHYLALIEKYRQNYPFHNFVTEKQVREICIKYGLVMGPTMLFTGDIPERNREEIRRFSLRQEDQVHTDPERAWTFLRTKLGRADAVISSSPKGPAFFTVNTSWFGTTYEAQRAVIPVGDGFVLVQQADSETDYDIFIKVDVMGSEWLAQLGEVNVMRAGAFRMEVSWRTGIRFGGRSGGRAFLECQAALTCTTAALQKINSLHLAHNVSPHIIAPGTMFEAHKDAVYIDQGYRLRFKETPENRSGFISFFIDDPIVLQPVPGGYLVVTKWGPEANLPEFQNGTLN